MMIKNDINQVTQKSYLKKAKVAVNDTSVKNVRITSKLHNRVLVPKRNSISLPSSTRYTLSGNQNLIKSQTSAVKEYLARKGAQLNRDKNFRQSDFVKDSFKKSLAEQEENAKEDVGFQGAKKGNQIQSKSRSTIKKFNHGRKSFSAIKTGAAIKGSTPGVASVANTTAFATQNQATATMTTAGSVQAKVVSTAKMVKAAIASISPKTWIVIGVIAAILLIALIFGVMIASIGSSSYISDPAEQEKIVQYIADKDAALNQEMQDIQNLPEYEDAETFTVNGRAVTAPDPILAYFTAQYQDWFTLSMVQDEIDSIHDYLYDYEIVVQYGLKPNSDDPPPPDTTGDGQPDYPPLSETPMPPPPVDINMDGVPDSPSDVDTDGIPDYAEMNVTVNLRVVNTFQSYVDTYGYFTPQQYEHYNLVLKAHSDANMMNPDLFSELYAELLKYEGWPYVWGGSNPDTGFDCSGLVQYCYGTVGVQLPRTAQEQYDATTRISAEELQPGDLIFFSTADYAPVTHVGVYVSPGVMYDSNGDGIGHTDYTTDYWSSKIVGYGRVK